MPRNRLPLRPLILINSAIKRRFQWLQLHILKYRMTRLITMETFERKWSWSISTHSEYFWLVYHNNGMFLFISMVIWQRRVDYSLLYLYRARSKITQLSIPTHAQLQRHRLKFIKNHLKNSYMFRSSTIFRELQCPR